MINGAIHQLSPSLAQSLQDYRSHVDAGRTPVTSQPEPSQSSVVSISEEANSALNSDKLKAASQENRDTARKVAVHTFEIKNTKNMAETLLEGVSDSDNNDDVGTQTIDPAEAYKTSMKYARRDAMINGIEAGESQDAEGGLEVNLLAPLQSPKINLSEKPDAQLTMANTHVDGSTDDSAGGSTLSIDTSKGGGTPIKYTHHESLISAFEKAAMGESDGSRLNIVV